MCHWSDMDWLPEVLAMDTATGQNVMPLRCWSMPDSSVILTRTQEFAGFLREEKQFAKPLVRYAALRQNCDHLRPIQLGISVADADGRLRGTWCFNLLFNVWTDLYSEASMNFLAAAGLDFTRHAEEGIEPVRMPRGHGEDGAI
ncbi:unnamed protein product [Cladocopium goreaui]|uniref:poly(A)-specific ribonuclease n=1 Tax=Cladocopium goreaui TaxID=2562237 RepID=A0A9P1FVC6_9DINO|nr:unnamed protein product [Cladocopium goreaui]